MSNCCSVVSGVPVWQAYPQPLAFRLSEGAPHEKHLACLHGNHILFLESEMASKSGAWLRVIPNSCSS